MRPAVGEIIRSGLSPLGISPDDASLGRIDRLLELLTLWNRRFRLTGVRDVHTIASRHVVDSLAVLPHVPKSGTAVDIGSGAGFPGIVLACALPEHEFLLIESRRRPASFLAEAVRSIGLPLVTVFPGRAEELRTERRVTVSMARAIRLDHLLEHAAALQERGTLAIAMTTPRASLSEAKRTAADRGWSFDSLADYRLPDGSPRRLLLFRRV